jgi:NADH/F420H2 dehydrogenase subunit C
MDHRKYRQGVLPSSTVVVLDGDETVVESSREGLTVLLRILRDHTGLEYKVLTELTAVDYPLREPRFDRVYVLQSLRYASRVRVKVRVGERTVVPSVSTLYKSANWLEREVWDRFGIGFSGHPDLRRLLTDYGFEGHPMRKDFPTEGYTQVMYSVQAKRVICVTSVLPEGPRPSQYKTAWQQVPSRKVVSLGKA